METDALRRQVSTIRAYSFKYPKAGERNSDGRSCGSATLADRRQGAHRHGPRRPTSTSPASAGRPTGGSWFFRLNRRQNTFEVIVCEPHGAQRTVYEERAQQYVERVDVGPR